MTSFSTPSRSSLGRFLSRISSTKVRFPLTRADIIYHGGEYFVCAFSFLSLFCMFRCKPCLRYLTLIKCFRHDTQSILNRNILLSYFVWLSATRTLKLLPHLWYQPEHVIYVPAFIAFGYYFAIMKIYALCTLHEVRFISYAFVRFAHFFIPTERACFFVSARHCSSFRPFSN